MTGKPPAFSYVGPPELAATALRAGTTGCDIRTLADLDRWAASTDRSELKEPFTFVVTLDGTLRLAPRRSEHVACAGGLEVLAAGEITLARGGDGGWGVTEISNLSTGYCPEPASWPAVADALGRAGIGRPDGFTQRFVFRHCAACGQRNVVKDDDYTCAVCGGTLPRQWNFASTSAGTRRSTAAVIDLPVPDDERAKELSATLGTVDNERFLQAVSGRPVRLHHRSVATLVSEPAGHGSEAAAEPTWSLLLRAVHLSKRVCNPIGKAFKRMENGPEDNIPYFYSGFAETQPFDGQ